MPKQTKDEKALEEQRITTIEGAIVMGSMIVAFADDTKEAKKRVSALALAAYKTLFPVVEKRKYSKKSKSEKITIEELPE